METLFKKPSFLHLKAPDVDTSKAKRISSKIIYVNKKSTDYVRYNITIICDNFSWAKKSVTPSRIYFGSISQL
uniref:Uncharacterized protein n=2 Tax=Lepeophtheirus salmonis TaxID=72036 RepID=A0A0K2TJU5_LEPSM